MTVNRIEEVSSSKVKVYIDEEFAFALYKGELRKYGIKEEKELTEAAYRGFSGGGTAEAGKTALHEFAAEKRLHP